MRQASLEKKSLRGTGAAFNIRTHMPQLLGILLLDRTATTPGTPRNILWANDNYRRHGSTGYTARDPITPKLITGRKAKLILPRARKTAALQRQRTKTNAEVFTPTWIVKKQNDAVDAGFKADDLETYVRRKWLEIACGEAPYMATRYDMETGEMIPLDQRCGFVDRKLARIHAEITDQVEWQHLVELAYQSSYGFEWNGDSLLLARENLLYTYYDNYVAKWDAAPSEYLLAVIATIISFNVFQMDGITGMLPRAKKEATPDPNPRLFDIEDYGQGTSESSETPYAKIMNWEYLIMEPFNEEQATP